MLILGERRAAAGNGECPYCGRVTATHSTLRVFRLPDGRFSLQHGYRLSAHATAYKERGYPCFYIRDGVLVSVTPATRTVAFQTPTLILELIELLDRKGFPLAQPHRRWLRKIARAAEQFGYGWRYLAYRRKARRVRLRRDADFHALIEHNLFETTSIGTQAEFLAGLHEIGHLRIGEANAPDTFLRIEAQAWRFALSQAREQLSEATLGEMIACYRSYLRYFRKLNRGRYPVIPVPLTARHFAAEYRSFENRVYHHRLEDLARSTYGPPRR